MCLQLVERLPLPSRRPFIVIVGPLPLPFLLAPSLVLPPSSLFPFLVLGLALPISWTAPIRIGLDITPTDRGQ